MGFGGASLKSVDDGVFRVITRLGHGVNTLAMNLPPLSALC